MKQNTLNELVKLNSDLKVTEKALLGLSRGGGLITSLSIGGTHNVPLYELPDEVNGNIMSLIRRTLTDHMAALVSERDSYVIGKNVEGI